MAKRVDEALVETGWARDLTLARALVMEGRVLDGAKKILKPSETVKKPESLRVMGQIDPYVSRGAYKLEKAIEVFGIDLADKVCLDVGASTGGFTDLMLRNGAKKVYAVDVGYNQLHWKLRSDPRVVVMERTNARFLTKDLFPDEIEFGATDVSFISLKAILPACFSVLRSDADFVALVKPQFEAPKEDVGEKGVVRDPEVHKRVLKDIAGFIPSTGRHIAGLDYSPIRGPEGNIEFLMLLKDGIEETPDDMQIFNTINKIQIFYF